MTKADGNCRLLFEVYGFDTNWFRVQTMTEERITETTDAVGNTHTTHTVITDAPERTGSGTNWVLIILLLVVAVVAILFLTNIGGAEMAKDNAVAEAAGQVGNAAEQVGEAAQNAGEAVEDAAGQ